MARILEEEIANAGVPPRGDQIPHLEEEANDDQALVDRAPLTYGFIRDALFRMT